jgi:hypothetical protein
VGRGGGATCRAGEFKPVRCTKNVALMLQSDFPDRGSHTASVQVSDRSGKPLCNTSATFHVQRSNLNSPTRRPTPTPHPAPRPGPPPKG